MPAGHGALYSKIATKTVSVYALKHISLALKHQLKWASYQTDLNNYLYFRVDIQRIDLQHFCFSFKKFKFYSNGLRISISQKK